MATPTPTPSAAAATGTAGRSRNRRPNGIGCRNSSTGHAFSTASLRNARSGLTTVGCPTHSSSGRSEYESEYAYESARS